MIKAEFKIGDEVFLEKGMPVDAQVQQKYVYSNKPFSELLTTAKVELGILYTNEETTKRDIKEQANHIANIIFGAFLDKGYEITFSKCKKFVTDNINVEKKLELTKFIFPEGIFVITKVIFHPECTDGRDLYQEYYSYKAVRKDGKDEIEFKNWEYYNNKWHFISEEQNMK